MAWSDKITTSLFGRRIGLQRLSSAQDARKSEVLVGPDAFRSYATTADTTSNYLAPYGVSVLSSANSASTNPVYRLDAPIPGVGKTITIVSTATGVASTCDFIVTMSTGAVAIQSTWSTSFTVLRSTNPVVINLMGITTALWALTNSSASFSGAATTST